MVETTTPVRHHTLPNNTHLVQTAAGMVLVNCPPETLKCILSHGFEPPQIIVVPPDVPAGKELGSSGFVRQGVNYASVEFLLYANFFGKRRTAKIITVTEAQAQRLGSILSETFSGPATAEEYGSDAWLKTECEAAGYFPPFGRAPVYTDLCQITSLEAGGGKLDEQVTIVLEDGQFVFYEDRMMIAQIPTTITQMPRPLTIAPARPLLRRELTLQFIGGSDGFDPAGITTCFVAYMGESHHTQATLFDTAAYLRLRLSNLGISPRQISEVVLSHLHEDHLAGLPELLLLGEQRIRLLTADVIYHSLLRVLSAMFDIPIPDVAALFEYMPLNPGQPITIGAKTFESIYAVHTIPTIAVRANKLYYSGDMRYDEKWFDELVEKGVLTPERRDNLIHFAEGADVLVQDAGGGAVHTTVTPELLQALAAKGQRVILAHTSQDELSEEQASWAGRIEYASSGHVSGMGKEIVGDEVMGKLETIESCPLFIRLSAEERWQLAQEVQLLTYEPHKAIIQDGELSNGRAYIVHSGIVQLRTRNGTVMEVGRGSSLGERGALEGWMRTSTVVTKSKVEVLMIHKELFQSIAKTLQLQEAFNRADWLWRQDLFRDMLWSTMLDLALDFKPRLLSAGEPLFFAGELAEESYLLVSGRIKVLDKNNKIIDIMNEPGEFFGGKSALYNTVRNASAYAAQDSEVWALPLDALQRFNMVYPHILMHMRAIEGKRFGER